MKLEKLIVFAVGGGVTLINLTLAHPAQAGSITTTFAGTFVLFQGGNMFDITTFSQTWNGTINYTPLVETKHT